MTRARRAVLGLVALCAIGGCKKGSSAPPCRELVAIEVAYPGASPAEVEQGIIVALEESVRGLLGVRAVESTASDGAGVVFVEVDSVNETRAAIEESVARISTLPEDAERPLVRVLSAGGPARIIVFFGDAPVSALAAIADDARERLGRGSGLTRVRVLGAARGRLVIEVDPARLIPMGWTPVQLAEHLRAAVMELDEAGAGETRPLIRVRSFRLAPRALEDIVIESRPDGSRVLLRDVATIRAAPHERPRARYDGQPAVALVVQATRGATPPVLPELPPGIRAATLPVLAQRRCGASRPDTDGLDILRVEGLAPDHDGQIAVAIDRLAPAGPSLVLHGDSLQPDSATPFHSEIVTADAALWMAAIAAEAGLQARHLTARHRLDITLRGYDLDALSQSADFLVTHLADHSEGVSRDPGRGAPEISVALDPRARELGVSVADVARSARAAMSELEVARLQIGRDEQRIVVVSRATGQRPSLEVIGEQPVKTGSGTVVRLADVARFEMKGASSAITRRDGRRIITVTATASSAAGIKAIRAVFEKELRGSLAPDVDATLR